MPKSIVDSENMIVLIFLVAIFVFVILVIIVSAILHSEARAKDEFIRRFLSTIFATLIPKNRIDNTPVPKQGVNLLERQSVETSQAWPTGNILLVLFLIVLLLLQFGLWAALHRGWTTYEDLEGSTLLAVDPKGQVWAVANGNIVNYPDDGEPTRIPLPDLNDPFLSDSVQSLAIDGHDRLWLGTVNGKIIIHEPNGLWDFYTPVSLEGPRVGTLILFDNQGQSWTNFGELAQIKLSKEGTTYTLKGSGLTDVDTMAIDASGQLWVLSTKGELRSLKPDGNWITHGSAIKEDPDTEWAFTPYGPARLVIDRNNQAWIGAGNGVLQGFAQDGSLQVYRPNEPHPVIYTDRIIMDGQGGIWGVTGDQGMYRFHPNAGWVAYNARNSGMANATATTLVADGQGRVWIGALGGAVRRFDPAAALPAQYLPVAGTLGTVVVPAALLGIITAVLLKIPLARPASGEGKPRNIPEIAFTAFSAAIFTLYTFGQRNYLTIRFMDTVFGDGWGFADVLMLVVPVISLSLIPLSSIAGAAVGIFVYRVIVKTFGK